MGRVCVGQRVLAWLLGLVGPISPNTACDSVRVFEWRHLGFYHGQRNLSAATLASAPRPGVGQTTSAKLSLP